MINVWYSLQPNDVKYTCVNMDALLTCFPKFDIQWYILTTATIYITHFNHFQISFKKTLMILKGQPVIGNGVKTYNTMAKRQRPNADLQNTTQKLKIE